MEKIKACIFDLDGVVTDTAKYHFIAWRDLARELGFDFTLQDNERLKGISRMASLEILLEIGKIQLDKKTKFNLAEKKNKKYVEYILKMSPNEILPGVREFLDELKSHSIKIALGSASKNAKTILNQLALTHYFDVVVDGTHVSNAKPDPEVFLKGAELLGVTPNHCVVFEDAEAGIQAAHNAKMMCIGVGSLEILKEADVVIPGFKGFTFEQLRCLGQYNID